MAWNMKQTKDTWELVMRELGLATAKPVSTPSTTENVETLDEVPLSTAKFAEIQTGGRPSKLF